MDIRETLMMKTLKYLINKVLVPVTIVLIVFYLGLFAYGKYFIVKVFTKALNTEIIIKRVKFNPLKGSFMLGKVCIPEENIIFEEGIICLIPMNLKLKGLEFDNKINLNQNDFIFSMKGKYLLSQKRHFQFKLIFDNIDLREIIRLYPGLALTFLKKGVLKGDINCSYFNLKTIKYEGCLKTYNIKVSEENINGDKIVLGMSIEDISGVVSENNNSLEIDFIYSGPVAEIKNLYNYRPGIKTTKLIRSYLSRKLTK